MKKKILILMLLVASNISPVISRPIMIRYRQLFQTTRMRLPSATRVAADYENGMLTLNFTTYTGKVMVSVSDSQGKIVKSAITAVKGNGVFTMDLTSLSAGTYTLSVVLGNGEYYGDFDIQLSQTFRLVL